MLSFLNQVWAQVSSFVQGSGKAMSVLGAIVLAFGIPVGLPMILLASILVGVTNALTQSNSLSRREKYINKMRDEVKKMQEYLAGLDEAKKSLAAEVAEQANRKQASEKNLDRINILVSEFEGLKQSIEGYIFQLRNDPEKHDKLIKTLHIELGGAIQELVNCCEDPQIDMNIKIANLEQINLKLHKIHKTNELPEKVEPKFTTLATKPSIQESQDSEVKAKQAKPKSESTWQNIKTGVGNFFTTASVGLGAGLLLFVSLQAVGLAFAIPTGGLSLLVNLGISVSFGIGAAALHVTYEKQKSSEQKNLEAQKIKLSNQKKKVKSETKSLCNTLSSLKDSLTSTKRSCQNGWLRFKNSGESLLRDIRVHDEMELHNQSVEEAVSVARRNKDSMLAKPERVSRPRPTAADEPIEDPTLNELLESAESSQQRESLAALYKTASPEQRETLVKAFGKKHTPSRVPRPTLEPKEK